MDNQGATGSSLHGNVGNLQRMLLHRLRVFFYVDERIHSTNATSACSCWRKLEAVTVAVSTTLFQLY